MQKLFFPKNTSYKDLPLDQFNNLRYSVYAIDLSWNYLFVNKFVVENLGEKGIALEGKNIWNTFPQLGKDLNFQLLKSNSEKGLDTNILTISPLTNQKIHITGQKLQDCYLFTASITPKKEELLEELKNALNNRKK
jgi:hypothetical protein